MLYALYITKSKIRSKLLGLLFSSPDKSYYLSELARQIGTSPGNIQRELAKFIKDRLILRMKKGNLVLFSVNVQHALYPELRSLILKTTGVEAALRALVEKNKDIQLALLYGSFANASEQGESDIDILVVSNGDINAFYTRLSKLETQFGREINPTVYSSRELKNKLKQKNTFLREVLSNPHHLLKGNLHEFQKQDS